MCASRSPSVLLLALLLLPAACADAGPGAAPTARRATPPNLIVILADDLGWGDLGCYGQEKIRTPRLDRMAAEGMRFTDFYSGSPVCAPARCTLLTGLHTGHAFIRDNDEMEARGDVWHDPALEGQRPLAAAEVTVAERLQERGYVTACIGKWGLGWHGSEGDPLRQGFDHFFGYLCQRQAHDYYPDSLWRDGEKIPQHNEDGVDREYSHDLCTAEVLAWVRAQAARPFFLYWTPTIPHLALQVPEDGLAEYAGAFPETPYDGKQGYRPHPTPRAAYAAMVSRLDRDVGRLLDLLAELGLADDTVVLFTSDNGASWVGGTDLVFFRDNGPLRGRKAQLWEGGIRVPMIAWAPGRVPAARTCALPGAAWDLPATLCALAGAPAPGGDGVSLAPVLAGGALAAPARTPLYWEFEGAQALRDGDWKLLRLHPDAAPQLFDLAHDPGESADVAAQQPERVAAMSRRLEELRVESALFPLAKP